MRTLSVLIAFATTMSLYAEYLPYVASDKEIKRLMRSSETTSAPRLTSSFRNIRVPTHIASLFAEALTNTVVRRWFVQFRKKNKQDDGYIEKTIRRNNMLLEYSAELSNGCISNEKCVIRLLNQNNQTIVFWSTRSFRILTDDVSSSEVSRVVSALNNIGIEISNVSLVVPNKEKYEISVSLLRNLGIIRQSLIGVDESAKYAEIRVELSKKKGVIR